jgi:glycosyltransferase involved in cell wall biosynthesis
MNPVDFSVIVPFLNKEDTIEVCIKSLLDQDYPKDRYEIICVDNNSIDNSSLVVHKYPSVILIQEREQGAYIARNSGILKSRGDFLVFSDADVKVPRNWLSNIKLSVSKGGFDILLGWYLPAGSARLLKIHSLLVCARLKIAVESKQPGMITASASNLVIRRRVFEKEGLFMSLPRSEDKYFVLRCFEKGHNIGFDAGINVLRNDITCLGVALLKNFTYGYANALYIDRPLPLVEGVIWEFIIKYFPVGPGLLLFPFFYYTGYCCGRLRRIYEFALMKIAHRPNPGE